MSTLPAGMSIVGVMGITRAVAALCVVV